MLDKFFEGGAVVFKNAVCAALVFGPSGLAVLSGYLPRTSGVYNNAQNIIFSPIVQKNGTMPEYFSKHGYYSLSNGMVFHKHGIDGTYTDFGHWAWDEHAQVRREGNNMVNKEKLFRGRLGVKNGEQKPEYKSRAKLS